MQKLCIAVALVGLIALSALAAPSATSKPAAPGEKAAVPVSAASSALAAASQPASAPAVGVLKTTVKSVTGSAQKLAVNGANKWEPLKVGDVLDEKTVIRTGFNSSVVLHLADRGEFTVNGATKIGISELRTQDNVVKGTVGIKYGTIHATIDSTKGANDFKISTPVATLSVRGSAGTIGFSMDSSANMHASIDTGHWQTNTTSGTTMTFTNGEQTNTGGSGLHSTLQGLVQSTPNGSSLDLGATSTEKTSATTTGTMGGNTGWTVTSVSNVGSSSGGGGAPPPNTRPTPPKLKIDFP